MTETESAPHAGSSPTSPKTQESTMTRNRTHIAAVTIVSAFAVGAIGISFTHQVELAQHYGVTGWQAWTAPFFIDGFMLLGRLGQATKFDAATNAIGRRFMLVAGLLSLAANILVGHTVGQRVFGALVVAGFVAAEWYAGRLTPAPVPAPVRTVDPDVAKARAAKAAATRKANAEAKLTPAQKAARTRAARKAAMDVELAAMVDGAVLVDAPVSPAP